jgi:palmitoyl-protein thioesterase
MLAFVLFALAARPVVLWHGMGDTCCFSFSMGMISAEIQKVLPGTYVYSVEIGSNIVEDEVQGFIGSVNEQVDFVCETIANDPQLAGGFNAIGFSQGSQFLRAVVERCPDVKPYNRACSSFCFVLFFAEAC